MTEQDVMNWWNNLPMYNMDKPCKRVLAALHFDCEVSKLEAYHVIYLHQLQFPESNTSKVLKWWTQLSPTSKTNIYCNNAELVGHFNRWEEITLDHIVTLYEIEHSMFLHLNSINDK